MHVSVSVWMIANFNILKMTCLQHKGLHKTRQQKVVGMADLFFFFWICMYVLKEDILHANMIFSSQKKDANIYVHGIYIFHLLDVLLAGLKMEYSSSFSISIESITM